MSGSPSGQGLTLAVPVRPWHRAAGGRDEAALIRQARSGSADEVETLVRRHWDAAHRTAFLIVQDTAAAEDIAQEAMLAAVRAIDGFDRRRPFRPWPHRIVVSPVLEWLNRRRTRRGRALDPDEQEGYAREAQKRGPREAMARARAGAA